MKKYITLLIILGLVGIGIVLFMFNRTKNNSNDFPITQQEFQQTTLPLLIIQVL